MNNFYLTLLSDSSLSTFSKNTQCDFKVKLDHCIQIEKDNWEVGLVEVITPTEVNNITKENNYVIIRFTDRKMCEDIDNCTKYVSYVDQKIYIQNGYYASPRHLVEEIQKSINFRYGLTLKIAMLPFQSLMVKTVLESNLMFKILQKSKLFFQRQLQKY